MQIFIFILCLPEFIKISKITMMHKTFYIFCIFFAITAQSGFAATMRNASNYVSPTTYNNMYPYMNNKMRTNLNPGVNPTQTNSQINVLARTLQTPATSTRRVVPRGASTARGAVSSATATMRGAAQSYGTARSATGANTPASATNNNNARRVVARSAVSTQYARRGTTATNNRSELSAEKRAGNTNAIEVGSTETLSSARCLADYTDCMNGYCQRENTSYNRCYCSAKLAQIDSEYQSAIDKLIKQILILKGANQWSDAEMNEYWMTTIGKYTGDNSWVNLENALNINWADTESRVRGQQAFATGHQYCVQHLRGCYYMAANLRDAYRSEIARDCASYETSLQRIKNAAESIVESYK